MTDFDMMGYLDGSTPPERDALADDDLREIRTRIADPGHFLPRGDDYTEPITSWSARAVAAWLTEHDRVELLKLADAYDAACGGPQVMSQWLRVRAVQGGEGE